MSDSTFILKINISTAASNIPAPSSVHRSTQLIHKEKQHGNGIHLLGNPGCIVIEIINCIAIPFSLHISDDDEIDHNTTTSAVILNIVSTISSSYSI